MKCMEAERKNSLSDLTTFHWIKPFLCAHRLRIVLKKSLFWEITTKPPLSCGIRRCAAAEFTAYSVSVVTKKVHKWIRFIKKFTCGILAVCVEDIRTRILPECQSGASARGFSANVHIVDGKASLPTLKFKDIQVYEPSPKVIFVIDHFSNVDIARCSPVCGLTTDGFHSCKCLTVNKPVWTACVDWSIFGEHFGSEIKQIPEFRSLPRHY